jgi:hypothetical protein
MKLCVVRPRVFIELAFHRPQCGWFYRRNVTAIRKKNCDFNFRGADGVSAISLRFHFTGKISGDCASHVPVI